MAMNDNEIDHLRTSISVAWDARNKGNHPFGAVLVDEYNQVVLQAENTVVTQRFTPEQLAHFTLYASTEPCAMCAGAIYWSYIGRVVYALSEIELYTIIGPSPEHLLLPCREVFAHSQRRVEVLGPVSLLDAEARAVHAGFWINESQENQ